MGRRVLEVLRVGRFFLLESALDSWEAVVRATVEARRVRVLVAAGTSSSIFCWAETEESLRSFAAGFFAPFRVEADAFDDLVSLETSSSARRLAAVTPSDGPLAPA